MPEQKFNTTAARTGASYQEQLTGLSEQLNNIQKQISYLDLYNITTSVDQEEELASAITLLPPGEALIINVQNTFTLDGETYKTGDVILRLVDNNVIHVVSNVGGVYFPSKLESTSGGTILTYAFSPSMPPTGTTQYAGSEIKEPTREISFNLNANNSDSNIYGLFKNLAVENNNKFDAVFVDSTVVKPLIKFFEVDGETIKEELVVEYTLTLTTDEETKDKVWVVSIDSRINPSQWNLWMQVK